MTSINLQEGTIGDQGCKVPGLLEFGAWGVVALMGEGRERERDTAREHERERERERERETESSACPSGRPLLGSYQARE